MDVGVLVDSLSPIERRTIKHLGVEFVGSDELVSLTDQDLITVMRALGLLEHKGLIVRDSSEAQVAILGILGLHYVKNRLPERVLIDSLSDKKSIPIGEIKNVCGLNDNEVRVAIGILKKKGFASIDKGRVSLVPSSSFSLKLPEELLLEKLPEPMGDLSKEEQVLFKSLSSRKDLVEVEVQKYTRVKLTDLGVSVSKKGLDDSLIEQLTPKLIKQNGWKGKKFRRYDLDASVPRMFGGKRHFVNQAKDYARSIWLEMGFKEMYGDYVDTSFWVFDTLFTAQDHPVREMQDTFYLKNITGMLPKEKKGEKNSVVSMTKKAHEGGVDKSLGWQYKWDEEQAKRVLLRTHTTCLSARTLRKIAENNEFPAKYFALGKCFRNETVDWSHGFEFNQTEGIVVDENANFRQLLGYLKQFFSKMGYDKIRIRPAYFAYTEPSLEIDAFHPGKKKWIELGGAGMFRPEVTIPMFGRHIPVLAWGPGFDRIIMEFYQISDLRDMYKNDITKLRETKFWSK